jgi:hypothetical protein
MVINLPKWLNGCAGRKGCHDENTVLNNPVGKRSRSILGLPDLLIDKKASAVPKR